MSNEIDWSKAPEGFPLWIEELGPKVCGDAWHCEQSNRYLDQNGKYWNKHAEGLDFIVHRKPEEQSPWNGAGLPPVGTVCEIKFNGEWTECEIVAHKTCDNGARTLAIAWIDENTLDQSHGIRLRPVRTAEQIAAEERKAAIDEMVRLALHQSYVITEAQAKILLSRIYDSGYRKVSAQ